MPKYQEPVGPTVVRIMKQLSEIEGIIFLELWVGVRNPEGVWGRLGGDSKISGIYLTSREMFDYFKETSIAKSHKLRGP